MIDELPGTELKRDKAKEDTFAGHRDYKKELMEIIKEFETQSSMTFKKEEIFEKTDYAKIPREEAESAFDDLMASGYLQEVTGGDGLYQRAAFQDYSPAFEDMPDW
jgi:DNA replicative helicase MCM subunit Mcm2 (Cdc46/Mcm family)|tara:strand:+ start:2318 stop:2635 length:318 start_codon:yes stop_codon:yes gene_type:complete